MPTGCAASSNDGRASYVPGRAGFLGSTGGVTDGGDAVAFARFDTAAHAKANSERPEQGQWWAETEKCFEGEVTFTDSEDVDTLLAGGSNDARSCRS